MYVNIQFCYICVLECICAFKVWSNYRVLGHLCINFAWPASPYILIHGFIFKEVFYKKYCTCV